MDTQRQNRNPNRLINEKSPYLQQHAYNPVDWFPWNEEAFAKAKQENKPVFLSIGYSSCHWCHVMAHESFEDEEMANLINERFVPVKVDREERPDIDSVYMKVCQMMTGQGGWPLNVFLTPEQIPFYAGTYFPKDSMYGRPGMKDVVTQLYQKYTEDPNHIESVTESVTEALAKTVSEKSENRISKSAVDRAFQFLSKNFDRKYGGFGAAPKFPSPHNYLLLLRYYRWTKDSYALDMAEHSLQSMAKGGIYDHIGFGFARYSTDDMWLVPHFEKMLYDNALLLIAYTESYQLTENPYYKQISEEIITFIEQEMTAEQGAFYSAIDADSEGVEGKYYVWTWEEIFQVLGEEAGERYTEAYDISMEGNFEGKNIPNLISADLERLASDYGMTVEEFKQDLESSREKLHETRKKRVYPHVDDKILTSWNALMIAALAKAGGAYGEERYLEKAERALTFIEKELIVDGRLMVRYRAGEVKNKGFLDDYAFFLWANLEFYQATEKIGYLAKAKKLADDMLALFWDQNAGGFFFYGDDSEGLIAREKEVYDGAMPSGNSVAAVMLHQLASLTGETRYIEAAEQMLYAFQKDIEPYPNSSTYFLQSLLLHDNPTKEVVILGDLDDTGRERLSKELKQRFLPGISVLTSESAEELAEIAPFAKDYHMQAGETTVYICENFACRKPITDIEEALELISWKN